MVSSLHRLRLLTCESLGLKRPALASQSVFLLQLFSRREAHSQIACVLPLAAFGLAVASFPSLWVVLAAAPVAAIGPVAAVCFIA